VDEQPREFGPDRGPGRRSSLLIGAAAAMPAGTKYGALVGAGCGFLWGTFWYPFLLFFAVPVYALAGVLLGALAAALVGVVSATVRSVKAGWLAGSGASLALGLTLLVGAYLAPPTPPPFGPGRPINPAADADEERTLERNYLLWMAEQDQGVRGGFILLFVLPATLCALTSAWAAARQLGTRHPEWVGTRVGSAPPPAH
jgi:MFS family permease